MTRPTPFWVGDWKVDPRASCVQRSGSGAVKSIHPRAMELLLYLAERPGSVVEKDELIDRVWGVAVGDGVLSNAIWELRTAFEDSARTPAYIETIPKRGYRLIAKVRKTEDETTRALTRVTRFVATIAFLAGLVAALLWAVDLRSPTERRVLFVPSPGLSEETTAANALSRLVSTLLSHHPQFRVIPPSRLLELTTPHTSVREMLTAARFVPADFRIGAVVEGGTGQWTATWQIQQEPLTTALEPIEVEAESLSRLAQSTSAQLIGVAGVSASGSVSQELTPLLLPSTDRLVFIEERAQALAREYRYSEAIDLLRQVLEQQPQLVRVRLLKAELLWASGFEREAHRDISQCQQQLETIAVAESSPLRIQLRSLQARVRFNHGEVIAIRERLLESSSDNSEYALRLAQALNEASRYERAVEAANRGTEIDPSDPRLWLEKARAWIELSDFDTATGALEEASRRYRDFRVENGLIQVRELRARILWRQARYDDAARMYQSVSEEYARAGQEFASLRARREAGDANVRMYRLDEAIEQYRAILEPLRAAGHWVEVVETLSSLGRVELGRHNADGSLRYVDEAVEEARKIGNQRVVARPLTFRASLYLLRGELELARFDAIEAERIAEALSDSELQATARFLVSRIHQHAGEFDDARRLLEELRNSDLWPRLSIDRRLYFLQFIVRFMEQSDRYVDADASARSTLRLAGANTGQSELGFMEALAAEVAAQLGEPDRAETHIDAARSALDVDGLAPDEALALKRPAALIAMARGEWDVAADESDVDSSLLSPMAPTLLVLNAEANLRRNDLARARRAARRAIEHLSCSVPDRVHARVALAFAMALQGETSEAFSEAEIAHAEASRIGLPVAAFRAALLLNSEELSAYRSQAATEKLDSARTGFSSYWRAFPDDVRERLRNSWKFGPLVRLFNERTGTVRARDVLVQR